MICKVDLNPLFKKPVTKLIQTHSSSEAGHCIQGRSTGKRKKFQNIAPDDDPVKAGVIKFDVFGKLIYK